MLDDGTTDSIPIAKFTHLYCVRGRLRAALAGGEVAEEKCAEIAEGDQLRVTLAETVEGSAVLAVGSADLAGGSAEMRLNIQALEPGTEMLVWAMKR